jgi:hypothetical protein
LDECKPLGGGGGGGGGGGPDGWNTATSPGNYSDTPTDQYGSAERYTMGKQSHRQYAEYDESREYGEAASGDRQGLTLVHLSPQPKPFWSHLPVSPCLIDWGKITHPTYRTKCVYVEPKKSTSASPWRQGGH